MGDETAKIKEAGAVDQVENAAPEIQEVEEELEKVEKVKLMQK